MLSIYSSILREKKEYMLVSLCNELVLFRYMELDFHFDDNSHKLASKYV